MVQLRFTQKSFQLSLVSEFIITKTAYSMCVVLPENCVVEECGREALPGLTEGAVLVHHCPAVVHAVPAALPAADDALQSVLVVCAPQPLHDVVEADVEHVRRGGVRQQRQRVTQHLLQSQSVSGYVDCGEDMV